MSRQMPFDKLAKKYDEYRPRYPQELVQYVVEGTKTNPRVVDCGSGTGIVLEWLLPYLSFPETYAVDISEGMISGGKSKFPQVNWIVGSIEDVLDDLEPADLIVAGQAYQWFNRKKFLQKASSNLTDNGKIAIIQNNRDYFTNIMLAEYESLLESMSPGYVRNYRNIDIKKELFDWVDLPNLTVKDYNYSWKREVQIEDFVGMSSSSTQVQRAIDAHGADFLDHVRNIAVKHSYNGKVILNYTTQLFIAR
ncbi:class I SAM-dependent methyltransferase [Rothia nasisuis]|uniref:class I SAM-dependent methyltransferase n=1 Tax=Rothia nasisuis TaxID=2109647 RepID=UPI001F2E0EBF|nr:class I SAM-dependent methyltransferase [Rothia nasisuis]